MTVLTPLPAAAWAKASPICSRGKRAVTSRLTPSLGMRASARRKAVPRPKAPRILISRKWVSQRSRGTWLPFGLTPTSWTMPVGLTSARASATSSGFPTASQTTSAPRPRESAGQRMDAARREENALGKATDPGAPWALAHAPGVALGALAAAVRRLARHHAPDEMTARAAAGAPHDPGVLVTEDQGRLPRKEPLGGVDVGAANASGVDVDHDLPGPGDAGGGLVDREPRFAPPGRDLHGPRFAVPPRFHLGPAPPPC